MKVGKGVSLIYEHGRSTRYHHAALIGGAIGLAFLAHPYPAILLATIVLQSHSKKEVFLRAVWRFATVGLVAFLLALLVLGCAYQLSRPGVLVMKAAEETDSQSEMGTDMIVVVSVGPQDPAKMAATEWFLWSLA